MQPPTIFVTGSTGKTGAAVVDQLLARGVPVRAAVRRRDARSAALEARGAEVVVADLFDPDQTLDALRNTQRAYYVPMFHPYMIQAAAVFALAARAARLEAVVQMGQWLSHRAHPAIMTRQTWLVDRLFADLPGTAHTIINPGMFADNFLRTIDFAALLGVYPILTGTGRAAPVANEDIARVVAAVLTAPPERHAGRSYRPTGPELLSGRDMAQIVARAVGHRVVPVELPFWMFRKVARQQRVNPLEVSGFRHYVEEMRRGTFEVDGVTNAVAELTGAPAESFETTTRRYAALPFARQTLGNHLRAFARFNLTPFYPGYDLERWDRQKGFPVPPNPSLSIDDIWWRAGHLRPDLHASDGEAAPVDAVREQVPALAANLEGAR